MFQQRVQNFCAKFVRNERKSKNFNVRNFNIQIILQVM